MDDASEFSFRCQVTLCGPADDHQPVPEPAPVPVRVSGTRGATLREVSAVLVGVLGLGAESSVSFSCAGEPVPEDAVLGRPPLLEGCTITVSEQPPDRVRPGMVAETEPALMVQVVAGPDAGTAVPLGPRGVVVGRGGGAGLVIDDPEVSRRHAVILPGSAAPEDPDPVLGYVRDLGSRNGTVVAGRPGRTAVGANEAPLRDGDRVAVGHTRLVVRGRHRDPAVVSPDGAGHLLVARSAHLREPLPDPVVRLPAEAAEQPDPKFPWMQIALPVVVAVPMALVWHQPLILFVALASPVFFLGQFLVERRTRRRKAQSDGERLAAAQDGARRRIAALLRSEERDLEGWHPDLATLGLIAGSGAAGGGHVGAGGGAGGPRRELWLRTPAAEGWLGVRLGSGRRQSRVRLEPRDAQPQPWLEDAPITVDLATSPVLGIAGPPGSVRGLARSVVAQLATLCSPGELRIEFLDGGAPAGPGGSDEWEWAKGLPHHRAGGASRDPQGRGPTRLLVMDAMGAPLDAPVDTSIRSRIPALGNLAPGNGTTTNGVPAGGVVVLYLGSTAAALPIECRATVLVDEHGSSARLSRTGAGSEAGWCPDGLSRTAAVALASALAPYRDAAGGSGTLPDQVQLVDLLRAYGTDPLDPASIGEAWRRDDGSCVVPMGADRQARWCLDLDRDGPHALVAGTTGAGKSQLLVSLIVGLAVTHPPEAVTFVLVDYKGGAAFGEVGGLPHVTGLVTDLDPHLTGRLLGSLGAEVKRRERLLAKHGAPDLREYRRIRPPSAEALPRLVVVVDEFRALVEELPDFIPGLVRLAAVGRSLGVHLVLATQRPAGVISADIRANVNLRIALRVRDTADSHDVVECPDAAALPPSTPGRAVVALPGRAPHQVQIATSLGLPRPQGPTRPVVERLDRPGSTVSGMADRGPARAADAADAAAHSSSLPLLVAAVEEAWREHDASAPRPPWLPALPTHLPLESLRPAAARTASTGRLVLGRQDRVAEQEQPPWLWDPSEPGNLAFIGGPGSGRTTALRTVAVAAGLAGHRVHVLQAGEALDDLVALPHVGNVVSAADPERCGRLFSALEHEVRTAADRLRSPRQESILLLDGWEALISAWSEPELLGLADRLLAVVRDARPGGIRVAAAGGRALLVGSLAATFTQRLLLRLSDPADAALAGVPSGLAASLGTAGRGLHLTRGTTTPVQVALANPLSPVNPQDSHDPQDHHEPAVSGAQRTRPADTPSGLWRVPALPDRLGLGTALSLPDPQDSLTGAEATGAPRRPLIGCAPGPPTDPGGGLVRAYLPIARNGGSLVLGRPGGGRTSALHVIEESLRASGAAVARIGAHSSEAEFEALAEQLRAAPDTVVLVDDAETVAPGGEEDLLVSHLHGTLAAAGGDAPRANRPRLPRVIASSTAADTANRYRGLLAELRSGRCGVVVGGVQPGDGEVFGLRLTAGRATLPGRAVIVDRGRAATVQVAQLAPAPSCATAEQAGRRQDGTFVGPRTARSAGHGKDRPNHELGRGPHGAGRTLRQVPPG